MKAKKNKLPSDSDTTATVIILLVFGIFGIISIVSEITSISDPAGRSSAITFLVCLIVFSVIYYFLEKSSRELRDDLKKKNEKEIRELNDRLIKYTHEVKDRIRESESENTELRKYIKHKLTGSENI